MAKTDHDLLVEIHATLMDVNGNPGLCTRHHQLAKEFYEFKRLMLVILAFFIGTGLISIGVLELLR